MEQGSIERDIQVDASPEVVFEVISRPEHMREWWPDDARQAVSKHLAVLDRVGLIHSARAGCERHYQVDEAQLARAVAQLSAVGATWDARLRRIKRIAEAIERNRNNNQGE